MDKQVQEKHIQCLVAIGKIVYQKMLKHNIKIHFFKIWALIKIMLD
jgi:hypothetical protein